MILVAAILGILMSVPGQTMGLSVFTDALINALQIERLELSNAYLIGTLMSAFLSPKIGRLYDKYGARLLAMFAASLMMLTLIPISKSPNIIAWISNLLGTSDTFYISFLTITLLFFMLRFLGKAS